MQIRFLERQKICLIAVPLPSPPFPLNPLLSQTLPLLLPPPPPPPPFPHVFSFRWTRGCELSDYNYTIRDSVLEAFDLGAVSSASAKMKLLYW